MSGTSGGALKRCPVEIWGRIFTLVVLEGGSSGYSSLPFVSKFFRDVSHPARIHSPFISFNIHNLRPLESLLLYLTEKRERHIHHLFVNVFNSQFNFRRPQVNMRRGDDYSREISKTLNKIFELLDPSLTTLTLYLGPGTTPPQIRVDLPRLQELNIFLCPHSFPRSDEPQILHGISMPSLKRLNIAYAGREWEQRIACDLLHDIHQYAPSFTHLRLMAPQDLLPSPSTLARSLGVIKALKLLGYRPTPTQGSKLELPKSLQQIIIMFTVYADYDSEFEVDNEGPGRVSPGGTKVPRKQYAAKSIFSRPGCVGFPDLMRVMEHSKVKLEYTNDYGDKKGGVVPFGLTEAKELWRDRIRGRDGWWAVEEYVTTRWFIYPID
ncbi:hypothetical protein JAAARDRAFT_48504 [Jaapia argillacea MUCL 33604]|uniref:Uncharacterized protein n=1 Tax=Jaapia argillacea MUCL 33604 TaxID=933084 RepID=A0A067PL69_9AGAM|nr:hypothetical protein JAAARDRAFT_48504 [Jaapia argillacea MUCL 33604]